MTHLRSWRLSHSGCSLMWDDYGLVDISCGFLTQKHSSRGHLELVSRTRMLCDFTILGRGLGFRALMKQHNRNGDGKQHEKSWKNKKTKWFFSSRLPPLKGLDHRKFAPAFGRLTFVAHCGLGFQSSKRYSPTSRISRNLWKSNLFSIWRPCKDT